MGEGEPYMLPVHISLRVIGMSEVSDAVGRMDAAAAVKAAEGMGVRREKPEYDDIAAIACATFSSSVLGVYLIEKVGKPSPFG